MAGFRLSSENRTLRTENSVPPRPAAGKAAQVKKLLIANRGEIAIRIARAAAESGIATVAIYAAEDATSLHVRMADEAIPLPGKGVSAYLDGAAIVDIARQSGSDAIHPGYGFLAENADFARQCDKAGLTFVGPTPTQLEQFGDKARARELAVRCEVPLSPGTQGAVSLKQARKFRDSLGKDAAVMIKAIAGGGGRGMRAVRAGDDFDAAWERCRSEADAAFGSNALYVERLIERARHIEVQIIGDGSGEVSHLHERDCTLQRRHQKLVEIAPAPSLPAALRERLTAAAVRMAQEARYLSLGTFEFLVDMDRAEDDPLAFAFMETNPRLQVEHTVTEAVTGIDLVRAQLALAEGRSLQQLGLSQDAIPAPRGHAVQLRINMETMDAEGQTRPSGGTLRAFDVPAGPGIRVDTFGYTGYTTHPGFDSLLAKLIAHEPGPDYATAVARAYRALCEFRIHGVETNIPLLLNLLSAPDVKDNQVSTRFVEQNAASLATPAPERHRARYFAAEETATDHTAGQGAEVAGPPGTTAVRALMQGRVVAIEVAEGDQVHAGQQVAVIEAMKMEHLVNAPVSGIVRSVACAPDDNVFHGQPLLFLEEAEVAAGEEQQATEVDLDHIRPDLAEVMERHRLGLDEARAAAVEKRHQRGQRSARENIADLVDEDSFIEYGALAIAAQRRRREVDDLIRNTPADGMIAGVGSVNGALFGDDNARCMVLSYDYTVLAGTQGFFNHKKKDRMLQLAREWRLPVVLFAEGGGGRPGDTDVPAVAGLDTTSFLQYARLSGEVPLVGIVSGRCFAGNAALLGCSDVIIATRDANIGMGGPAMIEGGGLGAYRPEEVGPIEVQTANGVVDIAVADESEAVAAARQYLSYFQGDIGAWECADQRHLRRAIPENRLRVYDIRNVIHTLADAGSVLELRRHYGQGIITALVRIEGRAVGLIANDPTQLGGAIYAEAADKAARFMQLCDGFGLPMVSLCDTPGFMVGPDAEKSAQVRRFSRMFVTGASMKVPVFTIVLRKGYGLGAQAMAAGSFHAPLFIASWPTGEFGGMGLEGAVRLGYRKELEAVTDEQERDALFRQLVDQYYEHGKATNMASYLEIDAVIDPVDTRRWIVRGLKSVPPRTFPPGGRRPFIDTW